MSNANGISGSGRRDGSGKYAKAHGLVGRPMRQRIRGVKRRIGVLASFQEQAPKDFSLVPNHEHWRLNFQRNRVPTNFLSRMFEDTLRGLGIK